jgi:hypothetical protein
LPQQSGYRLVYGIFDFDFYPLLANQRHDYSCQEDAVLFYRNVMGRPTSPLLR